MEIADLAWGLIGWINFKAEDTILYLGKEDDSFAVFFKEKGIPADVIDIKDVTGEWAVEHAGKYSYVICISYLERVSDTVSVLKMVRDLLTDNGRLLLGMNNRLGIRFFCGDTDPYTERAFDSIEGYTDGGAKEGRCYSRDEISRMLKCSGWDKYRFYSVFPTIDNASLLLAEDYIPNEDLSGRIFPSYNNPKSIFLKEESLYPDLVREGLIHGMANAFLIDCPKDGELLDVLQITSSMDRGKDNALYTLIDNRGTVEKRAAYEEGRAKLFKMQVNSEELELSGIKTVHSEIRDNTLIMPYIGTKTVQMYLKELLHNDKDRFLSEMDRFRETVLKSSEINILEDGTEVFKKGFFDLVPLNSFYSDGDFLFFDQEFCIEDLPVKVMTWRQVASFYHGDPEASTILPMEVLIDRYGLKEELERWQQIEWDYLDRLLNNDKLADYHQRTRTNPEMIRSRRRQMSVDPEPPKPYHIGYVAGAFDMFHIGHLNLLRRAKERCDYLVAGVISDDRVYELKNRMPIIPCHERMQVVEGCRYVDEVIELPLGKAGIRDAYERVHFDCMFSGDDHADNPGWLAEQAYLRTQGSDIVFVSYTKETSTTDIRKKMNLQSNLLTDKNYKWIYTYDYAPESLWEPWRDGIPSDWITDEASAVAGRIKEGLPSFVLLADSHFTYNGTWDDTVASMKALSEKTKISGIIHLGDMSDGLLPLAKTEEIETRCISDMESLGAPVYIVPGNHDYNYFKGNPEIKYPEKLRYYIDGEDEKMRLIIIDSFDPKEEVRYGFSDECITWLDECLKEMPGDYSAIIFSHLTPLVRLQAWTKDIRNRVKLMDVLNKHATKILAFINGHNHCDHLFNDLHNGQFPIISINCAKCEYFTDHKPVGAVVPERKLGDRTQESFDIMQVDAEKKEIYLTRFGAGTDRIVRDHKAIWS